MKYLKTNESFRKEKAKAVKEICKKYEDIISDCLLELYDLSYQSQKSNWDEGGNYRSFYMFDQSITTFDELKSTLKNSINKLDFNEFKYVFKLKYTVPNTNGLSVYSEDFNFNDAINRIYMNYKVSCVILNIMIIITQ